MGTSMRSRAAADGPRTPARRRGRLAGLAGLAGVVAALGAGAPAAQADTWGYEQVTPADGGTYAPIAEGVSADLSTVYFATFSAPVDGLPYDGRPVSNYYGTYKVGGVWKAFWDSPLASESAQNLIQLQRNGWAADGSRSFLQTNERVMGEAAGPSGAWHYSTPRDAYQEATSLTLAFAPDWPTFTEPHFSSDGKTVAYQSANGKGMVLVGGTPVQANVDDGGNPMWLDGFGGMLDAHPLSEDGSKVIFLSRTALDGDNDAGAHDLYQRDLVAGTTRLISDDTPGADPDLSGNAKFHWASPDGDEVMWSTTEQRSGDTDTAADLYYRDGDGPIVRISQGETVDGSPTGNTSGSAGVVAWVATSGDGNYVYFVTGERLTQDAPADTSKKLYERDIAGGVTRFVAGPLNSRDTNASAIVAAQDELLANHGSPGSA